MEGGAGNIAREKDRARERKKQKEKVTFETTSGQTEECFPSYCELDVASLQGRSALASIYFQNFLALLSFSL